jgi:hypothetical protein
MVYVVNSGAGNSMDVFPDNAVSSDTLNGGAGAKAVAQNAALLCIALKSNTWECDTLGR